MSELAIGYIIMLTLCTIAGLVLWAVLRSERIARDLKTGFLIFLTGLLSWQVSVIWMNNIQDTLFIHKIAFAAAYLALNGALWLAFTYPEGAIHRIAKNLLVGALLISLLLVVLVLSTNLVVYDYVLSTGRVVFGPLTWLANPILLFELAMIVWVSYRRYKHELNVRYYFRYVLLGIASYGVIASVTNLILPSLGIREFTLIGSLLATLPLLSIAYTLLARRLYSFVFLVNKVAPNLLAALLIWLLLVVANYWLRENRGVSDGTDYLLFDKLILLVLIPWLVQIVGSYIKKSMMARLAIFKDEDEDQVNYLISGKLSTSLDINEILERFISLVREIYGCEVSVSYLGSCYGTMADKNETLSDLGKYIKTYIEHNDILDTNELQYDSDIVSLVHNLDIKLVVPIRDGTSLHGAVYISSKKYYQPYTVQDVELLKFMVKNLNLALSRANLHREVQQFNEKLQKDIAEATRDLKARNRRLSVLRNLDQIIMNTLEIAPMAQKIVDLVSWEMGYPGALMVLLSKDNSGEYLRAAALSSAPIFDRALKVLSKPLDEYKIPWGVDPSNIFYKAINERKPYPVESFKDLLVPPLDIKTAQNLQEATKTKHVVVYPLSAKGKPLGAVAFSIPKPFDELSKDDKDLLEAFMDEAGIAIDSVRLYDELKQRNKELELANEKLTQLDKMKDELVSVASHELRTPMTAIKSYIWMALNKQKGNLTPELKKYLERAFISSDRMIELVNDMLSASRLEGGRIELDMQAYDIIPIIEEVVEQLFPKANERGLKLRLVPPNEEIPLCVVDNNRFREILFNLIGNSVKYTDEGKVEVFVSAHTKISPDDGREIKDKKHFVWIEIKDTGRGISKEDIGRLFQKFSKLEQGSFTKTAEAGGTGLGLYITKGLVELHGGKVWVHSEGEGKGSTFGFSVRVA